MKFAQIIYFPLLFTIIIPFVFVEKKNHIGT